MHSNLIEDLFQREQESKYSFQFIQKHKFTKDIVTRLDLKKSLREHEGCVNCLEWSSSGTKLASGSDDLKICIWDPFKEKLLEKLETKHRGNIFGLRFLPYSNDSLLISCAADRDIYVHDLNSGQSVNEIHAHQNRVKRLVTLPDASSVFFSAGEDGHVLQHDIRAPSNEISKILLNFSLVSNYSEAKCLSVNEVNPFQLAVGCNDPYARVYDRRMIKARSFRSRASDANTSNDSKYLFEFELNDITNDIPLTYYVPGHLPKKIYEYQKRMKTLSVTFLTFSPDGKELLVNLGGEQLYLFDLDGKNTEAKIKYNTYKEIFEQELKDLDAETVAAQFESEQPIETNDSKKKKYKLSSKAEKIKSKANECFENGKFLEAIENYNEAIRIAPDSAILYGNRAASLMKRNWDGDVYMAMKDCYSALKLDPYHLKSHFRLSRCLADLKWYEDANSCIKLFRQRFPDYANSQACDNLVSEIKKGLDNLRKTKQKSRKTLGASKMKKNGNKKFRQNESDDSSSTSSSETSASSSENESDTESDSKKHKFDKNNNEDDSSNTEQTSNLDAKEKKKAFKLLRKKYANKRKNAIDFKSRYCGHCNVATDIKEACYLGNDFIAAGSDDGSFFIWEKTTTNVVRVLKGDESIVNCLAPHPMAPMIATSGIDSDVKIWYPKFSENENDSVNERVVQDVNTATINNQLQMNSHPFEFLLLNLNQNTQNHDTSESVACRPS